MVNWGKQSAFDMFSNLMTFQALASQQGQAHPAVVPVISSAGATLTMIVHSFLDCSLSFAMTPESSANQEDILCGATRSYVEAHSQLAAWGRRFCESPKPLWHLIDFGSVKVYWQRRLLRWPHMTLFFLRRPLCSRALRLQLSQVSMPALLASPCWRCFNMALLACEKTEV